MMIRRCVICKKRNSAYQLLRIQLYPKNHLHVCFLRAYKESLAKPTTNKNIDPQDIDNVKQRNGSVWLCINELCIASLLKKPQSLRSHFFSKPSLQTLIHQIKNVFAHEFCRYIKHLYRQGNTTSIQYTYKEEMEHREKMEHREIDTFMEQKYTFVLLYCDTISLQENEIQRVCKGTELYLYKGFSYEKDIRFPHNIALWDHSVKQKYKNRTQRIQRILDIWARLRYID